MAIFMCMQRDARDGMWFGMNIAMICVQYFFFA